MIREAVNTDLSALVRIENEAFDADCWSRATWESELAGSHQILVSEVGDQLVAYAVVMASGDDLELLRIAVSPSQRRHGIARDLVGELIGKARDAGARHVFLEVEESNVSARALYESAGFVRISQRAHYYGADRHAEIMSLALLEARA